MISTPPVPTVRHDRDRLLVVGDIGAGGNWIDDLRRRYREWDVDTCRSYLSGIAELGQRPAQAVLACVDPSMRKLKHAVAGLRDVAGRHTRLVLCCTPEMEPDTRRVMRCGADDYVIFPIQGGELDEIIGYAHPGLPGGKGTSALPAASMEELALLGRVLSGMGDKPRVLLEQVAALMRLALRARGAVVVVEGAVGVSGEAVSKPVLSVPLTSGDGDVIGQLSVGECVDGPYGPADGQKLQHYASVVGNILQAASQQRQWRQLSFTDECTGLPNRRFFHQRLDEILARAASEHFHVTLLLFDVDDFKTYNDTYGHDAGDEVLRVTGELFRKQCREQDVVARYGGDEFAVVFWDADGPRVTGSRHPNSALVVLDRVQQAMKSQALSFEGSAGTGQLTISGGLSTFPWDGRSGEELFKKADDALLAAKRAGKNRIFLIGDSVLD